MANQFIQAWLRGLEQHGQSLGEDTPNYYASDPSSLITTSTPLSFVTGTGFDIYKALLPTLSAATSEIVLVTCFWAHSPTLSSLSSTLLALSKKALERGRLKLRVRICFSSLSLFQKLFHKQIVRGQTYPSSVWRTKLGLPDAKELEGLDLEIKSVFLLPFSVMHPKFIIVDRQKVFLPSCNVSWEEWFEGCIEFSGPIVQQFVTFWQKFWAEPHEKITTLPATRSSVNRDTNLDDNFGPSRTFTKLTTTTTVQTLFLPSPHHLNPRYQPLTSSASISAPPTPLNTFILILLSHARHSIYIQTPNLTSPPVLTALLRALSRGIDVHILTSARLMILEQLVTAGTTTKRCVNKLIKRYRNLQREYSWRFVNEDEERIAGLQVPGKLRIEFFEPRGGYKKRGEEGGEPQQSHLKMTIVDGEVLVLGSGNLDRASWFTSQELGVALFDREVAETVMSTVRESMTGRSRLVYDSDATS